MESLTYTSRSRSVAAKLHMRQSRRIEPPRSALAAHPADPMNKEFKTRFTVILLGLVTVGVATLGWINFQKEPDFQLPYDGVWWVERAGQQVAVRLDPNGPGAQAGIKSGDHLTSINQREVRTAAERVRLTFQTGIYQKATYSLVRQGVPVDVEVVLGAADRSLNRW